MANVDVFGIINKNVKQSSVSLVNFWVEAKFLTNMTWHAS